PAIMRRGLGDFAMEFYYHEIDRTVLILGADGGLNSDTSKTFVQQLESLVEAGVTRIIVDCTHLEYISSYGIGLLVRLHNKLAKHGGDVKIAGVKSKVLGALSVMRMNEVFGIYPDVDRARLAFRPKDVK